MWKNLNYTIKSMWKVNITGTYSDTEIGTPIKRTLGPFETKADAERWRDDDITETIQSFSGPGFNPSSSLETSEDGTKYLHMANDRHQELVLTYIVKHEE